MPSNSSTNISSTSQASSTIPQDNRQQQLHNWLQHTFAEQDFRLESLPGDASFRRYHRIYFTDTNSSSKSDKEQGYIIMDAPPEQESIVEFVAVDKLMAKVINVPTIIAQDIPQGFLVLQDFGTTEFAHVLVGEKFEQIDAYYQWAMKTLLQLQTLDIQQAYEQASLPDYDTDMLQREMALFSDWFLPYIGVTLDTQEQAMWQQLTEKLVEQILQQPMVVVHRDYHSRNLMIDKDNPEDLGVIDFQDAVIGSYAYDLLSLLRDAYVQWDEAQIEKWLSQFWQWQQQQGLQTADSFPQFVQDVNIIGVQRHLKILGIFVRLAQRDGKTRYLADIPKVMQDLHYELAWLDKNADQDIQAVVRPFWQWLQQVVMPSYQHTFAS